MDMLFSHIKLTISYPKSLLSYEIKLLVYCKECEVILRECLAGQCVDLCSLMSIWKNGRWTDEEWLKKMKLDNQMALKGQKTSYLYRKDVW